MIASESLGLFEGHELETGAFVFHPVQPEEIVPGDIPSIVVAEYRPPITPPTSDWYFANLHAPEGTATQQPHTGLDVNENRAPWGDVDLGKPVFATCEGLVVFAGMARGTSWGNLVITASVEPGKGLIFWRYAHLKDVLVRPGEMVYAGHHVGSIGKGYNDRYYAHLHLDAWRGQMIAPESWLTRWVDWVDPLKVWSEAGCDWEWGRR